MPAEGALRMLKRCETEWGDAGHNAGIFPRHGLPSAPFVIEYSARR